MNVEIIWPDHRQKPSHEPVVAGLWLELDRTTPLAFMPGCETRPEKTVEVVGKPVRRRRTKAAK